MGSHVLLGISGSLRKASLNTKLIHEAARRFDPETFVQADLNMPLYDGDLEAAEGMPAAARLLADQISAADAIVISTPEYNKAIPGVLKNALDWVSRIKPGPMHDKPVATLSATAGRAGGEVAQVSLRHCLVSFGPRVLNGPGVMIGGGAAGFDDDGRLTDDRSIQTLDALMDTLRAEIAR